MPPSKTVDFNALVQLRQTLHQYPELSGKEYETTQRILRFLTQQGAMPQQVIEKLGGTGMALVYEGEKPGPAIVFRCDLDALPISEVNENLPYASVNSGVSHKCGHDGHMTMLTGLALHLAQFRPKAGKAILLYQPAEETGQGAEAVLADGRLQALNPSAFFGLHNVPGKPLGTLCLRQGIMNAASRGIKVTFTGSTAHAAEPEKGNSPAEAMTGMILGFTHLVQDTPLLDFALCTLVHARLGSPAFGVAPGHAEVWATLRAHEPLDMELMVHEVEKMAHALTKQENLACHISHHEVFPAVSNNNGLSEKVAAAATALALPVEWLPSPFRWSEDFGHYSTVAPALFMGIGAGEAIPPLHDGLYDFPDALISHGVNLFCQIANQLLQ